MLRCSPCVARGSTIRKICARVAAEGAECARTRTDRIWYAGLSRLLQFARKAGRQTRWTRWPERTVGEFRSRRTRRYENYHSSAKTRSRGAGERDGSARCPPKSVLGPRPAMLGCFGVFRPMRTFRWFVFASLLTGTAFGQPPRSIAGQLVEIPSGNLRLKAFLWKPTGKGPFAAVLFNHGSGGPDAAHTAGMPITEAAERPLRSLSITGTLFSIFFAAVTVLQRARDPSSKMFCSAKRLRGAKKRANTCNSIW